MKTLTARHFRPSLEALEDRLVPATVVWDGGSLVSSRWTDAANWVGDVAPVAGDDLVFASGAGRSSATVDYGDGILFRSLTFEADYRISGNPFRLGDGGLVAHAGDVTIFNPWGDPVIPIVQVDAGSRLTLAGVLSGVGGLEKVGAGTLVLSAANTYAGRTVVREGVLCIQHNTALGIDRSGTDVFEGATLQLDGGIAVGREVLTLHQGVGTSPSDISASLVSIRGNNSWAGSIALPWGDPENPLVEVAADSQLTLSRVISGTGGLDKIGGGALILTADNTYQGETRLHEGTLVVQGRQPASPITVFGGTLDGVGTTGRVTLASGAFHFELNRAKPPRINVQGAVNLSDSELDLRLNYASNVGSVYSILANDGTAAVTGAFRGLAEGAIFTSGGIRFQISYRGGDGNDVVLTHVNSPALLPGRAVTSLLTEGGLAILTGTLTDPDSRDDFILEVNWGDGTRLKQYSFKPRESRELRLEHIYRNAGSYTIMLSWHDQHGAGNAGTLFLTVEEA